jgi:hypothetical protein
MVHPTVAIAMEIMGLKWPKGMRSWPTKSGFWVLECHYTADPAKDPVRRGRKWFESAVKGYPGGVKGDGWQTEMEINYGAGGGDRVFPFLSQAMSPVFIDRIEPEWAMQRMNIFAGYDYGTNNPSAFEVMGINERGQLFVLWELYEPCTNVAEHVRRIKQCPYFDRLEYIAADASIFKKDQQTNIGLRSTAELFSDHGLHLTAARKGQDFTIALRFKSGYWADPENPQAFVTEDCMGLKMELRGLTMQSPRSALVDKYKNRAEKLTQKNNHGWDAVCYGWDQRPERFVDKPVGEQGMSIAEFVKYAESYGKPSSRRNGRGGIVVN